MFVGCDTGGTFTDFVMVNPARPEQGLKTLKLSSTPDDPSRAVLEGLNLLCGSGFAAQVNHGTTVATNALLERTGGRVAFFTTEGFEEMLWLGRGQRDNLYALTPTRTEPPLERGDCREVAGRLSADGREIRPLRLPSLEDWGGEEFDAAAVCLMHASINPEHEEMLEKFLRRFFPRVFLSHQLAPGSGEYERGMTTLLAAYLSPKVETYLHCLSEALPQSLLRIVHSAGGLLTCQEARQQPQRLALSGPAAGLRGALSVGAACGETNLVTLDMGGTSTDVALLWKGQLPYSWSTRLEGFPLRAPTLDIHTIGAGGGSLALVDATGLLRVGPKSAGAVPGPACYGRGGTQPTVTDALCQNGFLPETLGSEDWPVDGAACETALSTLAQSLGLGLQEAADGILDVACNHLAQAVRKVTTSRGHDPSAFTLFPFGGAGPMLACMTAELLEMTRVLVPARAGVLSAWGALTAPWEREWSRPVPAGLRGDSSYHRSLLEELKREFEEQETPGESVTWTELVARRYEGQGETLVSAPEVDFHALHQEHFGFQRPHTPVETVEARVRVQAPPLPEPASPIGPSSDTQTRRLVRWRSQSMEIPVYSPDYRFESSVAGPFLSFQQSSTLFVPPGWSARPLVGCHLLLERTGR